MLWPCLPTNLLPSIGRLYLQQECPSLIFVCDFIEYECLIANVKHRHNQAHKLT